MIKASCIDPLDLTTQGQLTVTTKEKFVPKLKPEAAQIIDRSQGDEKMRFFHTMLRLE